MTPEKNIQTIEIQDQMIELYVQQHDAKETNNWHKLFVIEIAINCAKAELTELRRRDPEEKL